MVPSKSLTPRVGSERGAELVEFALVFPLLLLVVLWIVDFGFMFQRMEVVTNAAREGARIAVLPGYGISDVNARVCNYLSAGGVPTVGCGTTNPRITVDGFGSPFTIPLGAGTTPMSGKRVTVVYSHQYSFIGPFTSLFGAAFSSVPVRAVAIMRDEAQAPGP